MKKTTRYSMSYETPLYDEEQKELNDTKILETLKMAVNDYENGAIIEARDALKKVVKALDRFAKEN